MLTTNQITTVALPVVLFFLTVMVGAVGFYLKRVSIQISLNSNEIIRIQAKTEVMFNDMSGNIKSLRKDLSTLWSTLLKN